MSMDGGICPGCGIWYFDINEGDGEICPACADKEAATWPNSGPKDHLGEIFPQRKGVEL